MGKYHTPRALSEAISIEAGELLENFLFKPDDYFHGDLTPITDEIADVFIYLLNLVNSLKLPNFTEIVLRKIEKIAKNILLNNSVETIIQSNRFMKYFFNFYNWAK